MGKLLLKILIFIALLLVIVFSIPLNKRSKYTGLKEDCFYHAVWLHDRIFLNPKPVDIAFFGSSHTINAIDDGQIEQDLISLHLNVVNLGYCRFGDNLYYSLLSDLLKVKKPRIVVLEVREDEDRYSHPVFPYVAYPLDVWTAWPWFNRDIISDDIVSVRYRIQLLRQEYILADTIFPVRKEEFGFASSADTIPEARLQEAKAQLKHSNRLLNSFERNFYMSFPRAYIRKIGELCASKGVILLFVYLPQFGSGLWEPLEHLTYSKYGNILIPPREIFENIHYWTDENHLNRAGARQFSSWLSMSIKKKYPVKQIRGI